MKYIYKKKYFVIYDNMPNSSFKLRNYKVKQLNSNADRKKEHRESRGIMTDIKIKEKEAKIVADAHSKNTDEFLKFGLSIYMGDSKPQDFKILSDKEVDSLPKMVDKIRYRSTLKKYKELLKLELEYMNSLPRDFNLQQLIFWLHVKTKENAPTLLSIMMKQLLNKPVHSLLVKNRSIEICFSLKKIGYNDDVMDDVKNKIMDKTNMWKKQFYGDFSYFNKYPIGETHVCEDFQLDFMNKAREGKNIICTSKTGTGKTALAIAYMVYKLKTPGTIGVILLPGSVVALQVAAAVENYCQYALLTGPKSKPNCENPSLFIGEPIHVMNYVIANNVSIDLLIIDEIHTINMTDTLDTLANSLAIRYFLNKKSNCQIIGLSATLNKESLKNISDKIISNNDNPLVHVYYDKYFVTHQSHMVSYSHEGETSIHDINPLTIIPIDKLFLKDSDFNLTPRQLYDIIAILFDDPNDILDKIFKKSDLPNCIMTLDDIAHCKKQVLKLIKGLVDKKLAKEVKYPEPEMELLEPEPELDESSDESSDDEMDIDDVKEELGGNKETVCVDLKDPEETKKVLIDIMFKVKGREQLPALIIDDSTKKCLEYLDYCIEELQYRQDTFFPNWKSDREKDRKREKLLLLNKEKIEKLVEETKDDITINQANQLEIINEELKDLNSDIWSCPDELCLSEKKLSIEQRKDCMRSIKNYMMDDREGKISWDNKVLILFHFGVGLLTKDMPIAYQILVLRLLSDGYLGVVIGDFKALGQGVNTGVVTVIIPWEECSPELLPIKLQKKDQARGRAGRRGQGRDKDKNEGHEIFIVDKRVKNLHSLYQNTLPVIDPKIYTIPITMYLEVFKGCNGRSKSKDKSIIAKNIKDMDLFLDSIDIGDISKNINEMMMLDSIKDNWIWIYKIGNVPQTNSNFNDDAILIFYSLVDIINHDLTHKSISNDNREDFWKIILWLFLPYGDCVDKNITTKIEHFKENIKLSIDIPLGYDITMFNIIKENRLPDHDVFDFRETLSHINDNIIINMLNIEYEHISAVALNVYTRIGKLTSINTYLNKK